MRRTKLSFILPVVLFPLVFSACIALKPTGKISYVKQVYHDITARNNGYFNADEKLKKVRGNIVESRKDDYDTILSVYTDRDPEVAKSYSGDLDSVIRKTSTQIQNHEPSIYTPNSYLLVGISYYLKGDFDNALITFQFVNTEFKPKPSKKKKSTSSSGGKKYKGPPRTAAQIAAEKAGGGSSKGKSSSSVPKHKQPMTALQIKQLQEQQAQEEAQHQAEAEQKKAEAAAKDSTEKGDAIGVQTNKGLVDPLHWARHLPVRPDAMIWLVDTYTELKKYKEAEAVLTIIDADENWPSWQKRDVEIARANLFVKKGDFARAIPPLAWLTQDIKSKHKKVRYEYILAQIYERLHNNGDAIKQYKDVLDSKPNYQMSFNAKMSLARIAVKDNSMPTGDVIVLLKKLLKDGKNREFYDQVYFALAELSLKDGSRDQAITYYKKCIEASTTNTTQKAKAYLKLGELYFEDEKYETSQPYYDSTLVLIDKNDPKKPEVDKRNSILKNLVAQLNIIEDGDSILKLSKMSDKERENFVDNLIEKKQEEKEQKLEDQKFLQQQQDNNSANTTSTGGGWYFDNLAAKGSGFNDFIKRWGNRKLEDNWRRLDKSSQETDEKDKDSTANDNGGDTAKDKDKNGKGELSERDKMLKNIPSSDDEIKKINDKIVDAYYALANIYSIELKNAPKAIATFEELLTKYPDNKYLAETYYNLYLLYDKVGNKPKSDYYKDLVLGKYPDSKFANIIRDPDYLKKLAKANDIVADYYAGTYDYFVQGLYDSVFSRKAFADSVYSQNTKFKPRFALLEAFAIGKTKDLKTYKESLQSVIQQYPTDSVRGKAEEILKYLDQSKDTVVKIQNDMTRYEYNPDSRHFFMIRVASDTLKLNDVIIKIAKFNDVNRSLDHLKIEPLILPDGNILIMVKSFDNLKKARDYYDAITQSESFKDFPKQFFNFYLISDINMNKVIINKEINSYFDYYNIKYIK